MTSIVLAGKDSKSDKVFKREGYSFTTLNFMIMIRKTERLRSTRRLTKEENSLAQPDPLPNCYAPKGSGDNHAHWLF